MRIDLLPQIGDPDRVADALLHSVDLYIGAGRLADARVMTERMEETVAGLTPHHKVHGLETRVMLEEAVGDWAAVRQLTKRGEETIAANLATPCPFNLGALIVLATAWTLADNPAEAGRLLAWAKDIGMTTYEMILTPRWLRLAIAQDDRKEIRRIIDSIQLEFLGAPLSEFWAVLFDGLVVLDDRERIEAEAPRWLDEDAYTAPFAARALALARRDAVLLEEAAARFEAMGLERHAESTRALLAGLRKPS